MSVLRKYYPGATAVYGQNPNNLMYDNYFYCDGVNDHIEIQAAIDYCAAIEDAYTIIGEIGVYEIKGNLTFAATDKVIFKGSGLPALGTSPTTTGGTVLNCYDDAQITSGSSARIIFKDIAFNFQGTYTDSCIDLLDNHVNSYNCLYKVGATVPNGNAGNPSSTPSGICIAIGKFAGPSGVPMIWRGNLFYDSRQGSATANCFIGFGVEELMFEGNYLEPNFVITLVNPNFMGVFPVSSAVFSHNTIFTNAAWDTAGCQYYNQYMTSGSGKNITFYSNQFFTPADIANAHLYTNSGQMYVYGEMPIEVEGGYTPVDLSVGGAGTVYIRFSGRGYETWGSATIPNGTATTGNIAHGLVGTPTYVSFTGTSSDTEDIYASTVDATNIVGSVIGNVGGDRTVYYYARYSKVG